MMAEKVDTIESQEARKVELFGKNDSKPKPDIKRKRISVISKWPESEEEEIVDEDLRISKIGWQPLDDVRMIFLEWGPKEGVALIFGKQENTFDIVDNSQARNERLFIGIEILDQFNEEIIQKCCRDVKQKGHNFDLTILGCDGGEVLSATKSTANEVIMTRGSEIIGVIIQEDGLGSNQVPFKYTIHDQVGPFIVAIRSQFDPVTDWGLITYKGDPTPTRVGKIGNHWYGMKGGLSNPNTNGFGLEFLKDVDSVYKGYMVAFLFTIYFRFSHGCHIL